MSSTVIKIVILVAISLSVAFSPAAHILKHVLSVEPRYDGWQAKKAVQNQLKAGDLLYFSNDRFLPPFLDLVSKMYAGNASIGTYWIFPYLVIGREYESRTVADFVCHVARHEENAIVWGISKEYISRFEKNSAEFDVRLGFWRQVKIKFSYSDILYEVYDGLFARGQIERITLMRDGEGGASRKLYQRGEFPAACS